jgi:Tfp pilus assembly protein PilF
MHVVIESRAHGPFLPIILIAFTALLGAQQSSTPTTGSGSAGSKPNTGAGSGTTTTGSPPNMNSGVSSPFGPNQGVAGRLVPNPATKVAVELYQDGVRVDTTFTSSDGTFRFPRQASDRRYEIRVLLGPGQEVRQEVDFQGGFPAVVQLNQMRAVKSKNDQEQPAAGIVSTANLMAPKRAQQEFEKGSELAEKKKFDEALAHFRKAVEVYAKYPAAYNEMGKVERAQDHLKEAEEQFQKAIDADPKWTLPYVNLAQSQLSRNDFAGMMKTNEKALAVDPTLALPNFFNAVGYFSMGRMEEAEKSALTAERTDQGHTPQIQLLLARVYEARGNAPDALVRYKEFLKENPGAANAPQISARVAEMERAGVKP